MACEVMDMPRVYNHTYKKVCGHVGMGDSILVKRNEDDQVCLRSPNTVSSLLPTWCLEHREIIQMFKHMLLVKGERNSTFGFFTNAKQPTVPFTSESPQTSKCAFHDSRLRNRSLCDSRREIKMSQPCLPVRTYDAPVTFSDLPNSRCANAINQG